jgi:antibiotic biosynthesis monooxygenase (ABM) superfamily enzyme
LTKPQNCKDRFTMFRQEQSDPTAADEGRFLSESELLEWHRSMQRKYPQVFTADDKLFGEQDRQHEMGTQLMTWFDEDPNKPMRVEVRGSRWKIEFGDRSPVYVVKFRGSNELSQIELTSAHEEGGWQVGWDLTPPGAS